MSFIVHNRVSFGGLLIMNGLLYWWLTRQITGSGRRWAWWTLCLSGAAGVSSYLAYYPHGYWDPIHALGTTVIAAALATGLARPGRIRMERGWRSGQGSWCSDSPLLRGYC